jgi:hypothetical protein
MRTWEWRSLTFAPKRLDALRRMGMAMFVQKIRDYAGVLL